MIRENKTLMTDWDDLYMTFNKEFDEDVFEEACADEWPLIYLLEEMKDDVNAFENIIEFFLSHYSALWYDHVEHQIEEVEYESAIWYEGLEMHRQKILALANYFKSRRIEELLTKQTEKESK